MKKQKQPDHQHWLSRTPKRHALAAALALLAAACGQSGGISDDAPGDDFSEGGAQTHEGVSSKGAQIQLQSSEPELVGVGHGVLVYADGSTRAPTLANIDAAQTHLLTKLLKSAPAEVNSLLATDKNLKDLVTKTSPSANRAAASAPANATTLSDRARLASWLIGAEAPPNAAALRHVNEFMAAEAAKLTGEAVTTTSGTLPTAALSVAPMIANENSGQTYWNDCQTAGVPNPPAWSTTSANWVRQGTSCTTDANCGSAKCTGPTGAKKCTLEPNFLKSGVNEIAEVYTYTSTSPAGVCIALPRRSSTSATTFSLLGIICQGTVSSRSCFWDSASGQTISTTETVTIPTSPKIIGGAALDANGQGVCTDCHAGENAFIVHPGTALDVPNRTPQGWGRPLVKGTWPQNVGPGKEMDTPGYDCTGAGCHSKQDGRRFPRLEDVGGYCSIAQTAVGSTMIFSQAHEDFLSGTNGWPFPCLSGSRLFATKFETNKALWNSWFAPASEVPRTGDFNGDGHDDIVTFTLGNTNDAWVALSNGSSAFTGSSVWHGFFGLNGEQLRVGDFNGDGKDDIVVATMNASGHVYVALSSGTAFGTSSLWNGHILTGEVFHTGDFNGDRKDDIAIFTKSNTNDVLVQKSNGSSFGSAATWHTSFSPGSEVPLVGDFNADGYDDVVSFTGGAAADVFVAKSNGSSFGTATKWNDSFGATGDLYAVGDVNGDGKDDIVSFTPSNNDAYVALSTGSAFAAKVRWHSSFNSSGQEIALGDVDADHRADAILFTKSTTADVFVSKAIP